MRVAIVPYAPAGLIMLTADWPAALADGLTLPYLVSALPYRDLDEGRCRERTPGGGAFCG